MEKVPGRVAPVLFIWAVGMTGPAYGQVAQQPAAGQQQVAQVESVQPPISSQPVPSGLELSKLIWTTMASIDHANQSGNYSVLRDNASPAFQIMNNPSRLSEIFRNVRESRLDLSNTLLLAPTYTAPPTLTAPDIFRVQGIFGLRPTAISFDLYYQWMQGRWRLYGIAIGQRSIAAQEPNKEGVNPY